MYNGLFSCKFDMCDNNDGFIIRNNFKWRKYQNNRRLPILLTSFFLNFCYLLTMNHRLRNNLGSII